MYQALPPPTRPPTRAQHRPRATTLPAMPPFLRGGLGGWAAVSQGVAVYVELGGLYGIGIRSIGLGTEIPDCQT